MKKFWTKARLKPSKKNTKSCTMLETTVSDGLKDTFTPTLILPSNNSFSDHFLPLHVPLLYKCLMCLLSPPTWGLLDKAGFTFSVSNYTLSKPFLGLSPAPVLPILSDSLKHQWKNPLPMTLKFFKPLNLVPHRQLCHVWMLTWDVSLPHMDHMGSGFCVLILSRNRRHLRPSPFISWKLSSVRWFP